MISLAEKHLKLVERLIQKTGNGKISWRISSDPGVLLCDIDDYGIMISSGIFGSNEDIAGATSIKSRRLAILNSNGDRVELVPDPQSLPLVRKPLEQLYEMARRSALGQDQVIDDLLRKLG